MSAHCTKIRLNYRVCGYKGALVLLFLQLLRDTFIFKIVPMLNPDGVIVGNYRYVLFFGC